MIKSVRCVGGIISFISGTLSSKKVSFTAVMIALVAATTLSVRLPITVTGGYINFGDAAVILSGILFGPFVGSFAGGVGSGLADILGGYAHWAPFTLVIKGSEGLIVGLASRKFENNLILMIFTVLAGLVMVVGYFITEIYLYGYPAAITELLGNSVQIIAGIIGGIVALFIKGVSPWDFMNFR